MQHPKLKLNNTFENIFGIIYAKLVKSTNKIENFNHVHPCGSNLTTADLKLYNLYCLYFRKFCFMIGLS